LTGERKKFLDQSIESPVAAAEFDWSVEIIFDQSIDRPQSPHAYCNMQIDNSVEKKFDASSERPVTAH
jgi:hypothetical protein